MNTLTKAISGVIAIGALGLAINAQAVDNCSPTSTVPAAAPAVQWPAAATQVQAPRYPTYSYQRQWYPSYYGYRAPWRNSSGWNSWSGNRNDYSNYSDSNWDSSNYGGNRNRSNYDYDLGPVDSYVDAFGNLHFDMDFDLEFDWDWEADADIDADADSYGEGYGVNDNRFDNRFDNRYNNRYYNPYYGRYAPYNYYYNYRYGYPAAQQAAPAPAAPQAPARKPPVAAEQTPIVVNPISIDDDKDSVLNSSDFCPNTVEGAQVDAFGCAVDEVIVLRGVNFHTDSDKLADESIAILDSVSKTLKAHPELKLEVSGHTDSDAENDYNRHLSQRRAERVREYLIGKGAAADNLTAKGYGEEKPIATNGTTEGKALNRRVELNRL